MPVSCDAWARRARKREMPRRRPQSKARLVEEEYLTGSMSNEFHQRKLIIAHLCDG